MSQPGILWLSLLELNQQRINTVIQQLIEGRSNATGTVTLSTGVTSTTVTAPTCGASSVVKLNPQTLNAAAAYATSCVKSTDVSAKQFIITHASSSTTDRTFSWFAVG